MHTCSDLTLKYIKQIKGAADKNGDFNGTYEQGFKKNTEKVEKFDPRKSGNPVHGMKMLWIYSALYTICTLFQPIYLNSAPNLEDSELL